MDQRHVAQVLDLYLGRPKIREGMRASDAGQEGGLVREGAVGVGGTIVVGEMLAVPGHVGFLCRKKIASVESLEGSKILRLGRHALSSSQRSRAPIISQVPVRKKSPWAKPVALAFTRNPARSRDSGYSSSCAHPCGPELPRGTRGKARRRDRDLPAGESPIPWPHPPRSR